MLELMGSNNFDTGPIDDPSYWTRQIPQLTVSATISAGMPAPAESALNCAVADVALDGATVATAAVPRGLCDRIGVGIEAARERFGHEMFVLVYDEPWEALSHSLPYIKAIMGSGVRAVPMPFVNYVPPGHSGFSPHRDRKHAPFAADGTPNIMTVWTAITDAPTNRGCLAIVPSRFDENFPDALDNFTINDVRNIRALPVGSGDAVIFNQAVLHMGTRNVTNKARMSFAIEIERHGLDGARSPSIELGKSITFEQRLALVGVSIAALSRNNLHFTATQLALAKDMTHATIGSRYDYLWE